MSGGGAQFRLRRRAAEKVRNSGRQRGAKARTLPRRGPRDGPATALAAAYQTTDARCTKKAPVDAGALSQGCNERVS